MKERLTARVLLLDPEDRILLMKGRLPSDPDAPGAWFTVGGGIEPGESLEMDAREYGTLAHKILQGAYSASLAGEPGLNETLHALAAAWEARCADVDPPMLLSGWLESCSAKTTISPFSGWRVRVRRSSDRKASQPALSTAVSSWVV